MTAVDFGDRPVRRWRGGDRLVLVSGTGGALAATERTALLRRVVAVDAGAVALALLTTSLVISGLSVAVAAVIIAVFVGSLGWLGAYDTRAIARHTLPATSYLTAAGRVIVAVAVLPLLLPSFPATSAAVLLAISAAMVLVGRWAMGRWVNGRHEAGHLKTRVLVRGSSSDIRRFAEGLRCDPAQPFEISAVQIISGTTAAIPGVRVFPGHRDPVEAASEAGVAAVAFLGSPVDDPDEMRRAVWGLEQRGIEAYSVPVTAPLTAPTVEHIGSTGLTALAFRGEVDSGVKSAAKVGVDTVLSAVALLVLSPLMLGIALAVRRDSSGPVFFRQVRVGRDGGEFTMLKYRTMYCDAEKRREELVARNVHEGGTLFKIPDDPRITRVGKTLRRYSLDELPQLINVLRGHMALVGPRPPLPEEVANYPQDAHRRFRVKPGLTGLWQVSGRSDLDPAESVRLDTHYVENWSPGLDIRILVRTVHVVVTGSGAY